MVSRRASAVRPARWLASCVAVCVLVGCTKAPRWNAEDRPEHVDVKMLLESEDPGAIFRHMRPEEIPVLPVPTHLRPCCAFGSDLHVRIGFLSIAGVSISNILDPTDLGHHYYDNGILPTGGTLDESGRARRERNGLVYTCRGGFFDTAHVREWVDWTIFIGTTIARNLEHGIAIELPPEGGARVLRIAPTDRDRIEQLGRRRVTIPVAQWLAYQLSVWHEIVTWFGWSEFGAFPEIVSAFSPEDLYSNVIGIKIMAAIAAQRAARTESLFNESVDRWMGEVLVELGAVSAHMGKQAAESVAGHWWDPGKRLPDSALVRRRNLDIVPPLRPWLVPADRMPESLRAACGESPQPLPLNLIDRDGGGSFRDRATVEIELDDSLAAQEPFVSIGRRITQDDFPAVVEYIREQVRAQFGPDADRFD